MNVMESFSLAGKVALVTGGAGLYGRQIAQGLAESGAKTYMASRNIEKLEAQAQKFRDEGLDITALQLDQESEESVKAVLKTIVDKEGKVDVLVNNAVARPMGRWDDDAEKFAKSMSINATGIFMMTREFGNWMADNGGGSIVMIGSIQGVVAPDFTLYEGTDMDAPADYFFHKGGMCQLTRYVASKLGPKNVRVNCLLPGGFYNGQDDQFLGRYNSKTLLGRMADDEDLKGPVIFLASDASKYVTGAMLAVDGGYIAK